MLENLQPKVTIRDCKIRTILAGLDKQDAILLNEYLADLENWTPHSLSMALRSRGIIVDYRGIKNHRDMTCSCRLL